MTCRELMLIVLANHLEDEPLYSDNGILIGFMTVEDAAKRFNVDESTVLFWINNDLMEGIKSNGNVIVPVNAVDPRERTKTIGYL
ncbi:MAG: helix-turn-helix domain-containing protein [Prevotellaceae bacterium]|nr:helix-turn-helix domain-containing protein [Candidatus Faecinaster equi]